MKPERFIGQEILTAIARLDDGSFLGPWPSTLSRRRWDGRLSPVFYPEDHAHPHVELCHLLSGTCALSYRFRHYRLSTGDLGFFPPNLPHAEACLRSRAAYRMAWWILMSDRAIVQVTEYRRRRYRIVDRVTLVPLGQDARLACRRLSRMIDRPRPPRVADVREALVTLTLLMLRRVVPRQGGRQSLIEQAQEYIRTHPDPSLADVARAVLLSPNYLTSLFRAETGLSLGSTIQRERMVRAKELLADSRRTVKDVAYEIGFDDPSSFSRAFKRVEGISPLHFRRGQC